MQTSVSELHTIQTRPRQFLLLDPIRGLNPPADTFGVAQFGTTTFGTGGGTPGSSTYGVGTYGVGTYGAIGTGGGTPGSTTYGVGTYGVGTYGATSTSSANTRDATARFKLITAGAPVVRDARARYQVKTIATQFWRDATARLHLKNAGPPPPPPSSNLPTCQVLIAFGSGPTSPPIWTDVTKYVQSVQITRGRQRELDRNESGTATIVLNNMTRVFDPNNAASPYFGNMVPIRRVQVIADWLGSNWPIYTGFVESWVQTWPTWQDAITTVTCSDGMKALNLALISNTYAPQRVDQRLAAVIQQVGFQPFDFTIPASSLPPLGQSVLQNVSALQHAEDAVDAEGGTFFVNKIGQFQFIPRQLPGPVSMATFGENELVYADIAFTYDDSKIRNDIRITRDGGVEQDVSDQPSILSYFPHTFQQSGLPYAQDADSWQRGSYMVLRYAQPFQEITQLILDGAADPSNLWQQIFGRELGDVVTVNRSPPSGGALISQVSNVQGINLTFDAAGGDWSCSWWLSQAFPQVQRWILGDSTWSVLGTSSILAP